MVYTPGKRSSESPKGRAKLAFNKAKTLCQIQFAPDQKGAFAGRKYKVSDWPDWVKPKKAKAHEWNVRLGKDEIFSLYPWKGMFEGKFVGFAAKDGEVPTPKLREYSYGGTDVSFLQFTALLEITNGLDGTIGATVPYTLRYYFGEDANGNVEYTHWGNNAKHAPLLHAFLTAAGAWQKGALKYSDNILPKLEKRMLKANETLMFQIKDGWILGDTVDSIGADVDEDDPLWTDDDEFEPEVEE